MRARLDARQPAPTAAPVALDLGDWQPAEDVLARARQFAQVGAALPPMTRLSGLKRAIAGGVAKAFLRVAQLITRDQREFNLAVLEVLRSLYERSRATAAQIAALRAELAAARAEARRTIADLEAAEARERERAAVAAGQLRTSISLQERRLDALLEEARKRLPAALDAGQLQTFAVEGSHLWDATYLHFEAGVRVSMLRPRLR